MRGMARKRRKWNRIPIEEVEGELFRDGIPLEHWFVISNTMHGFWVDGQAFLVMHDDDDLAEACMRYLKARGAMQFSGADNIPNEPPNPTPDSGG